MRPIALTSVNRFTFTLALLAVGLAAPAHAETLNCTAVTSLPATISTQGIHCLMGNLATAQTSGDAITITANNVTLDLNGFKLGGQAAGSATGATGILSTANNVTVKNGIVRGFRTGIFLQGRGAVVEDLLVDQNTLTGILVTGQGAIVRRNQVVDTGGSTFSTNVFAVGIQANGTGSLVEHNVVEHLVSGGP